MTTKHPRPRSWTDDTLITRTQDYNKLSAMHADRRRSNYHRYLFMCIGELIRRGLLSAFEQQATKKG
jgi:hypothetical protein